MANNSNQFSYFLDSYSDCIEDYISKIKNNLKNTNYEYNNLINKLNYLFDNNENILNIFEGLNSVNNLSSDECKIITDIINIYIKINNIEEKEIYYCGAANAYDYFHKIKLIK